MDFFYLVYRPLSKKDPAPKAGSPPIHYGSLFPAALCILIRNLNQLFCRLPVSDPNEIIPSVLLPE